MNVLWMLVAFDWATLDATSLLEPQRLEREEVIDLDELTRRGSYTRSRLWIPETAHDESNVCLLPLTRTLQPNHLRPYEWEVGHWSATQITPSGWPFRVDEIKYYLGHEGSNDATLEHTVALYVSADDEPPASADPIVTFDVALDSAVSGYNLVTWTLEEPFALEEGEHLYVAIQHTGDWPDRLSVLTCPAIDDNGWWSNTVDQPYDWAALTTYGIYGAPMITVNGYRIIE